MAEKKRRKNAASPQATRRAATRMADAHGTVRSPGGNRWEVASESSPGSWHRVAITEGGITCDCPCAMSSGRAPPASTRWP